MASFNQITLLGNVGSIDTKTFNNGCKIVGISLATSKTWRDTSGTAHDEIQWHKVLIGGKLADIAERYVRKGDPLFVTGEMTYRQYNTKDGVTKTAAEVRTQSIQLLTKGGFQQPGEQQPQSPSYQPAPAAPVDDPDGDLPF